MQCGLLGRKLGHSYSPQIHRQLADYRYELFEKEPEELEEFLRHGNFSGLNVTVPYKKAVIPYLDELSDQAMALGAVNTIVRRPDGSLIGHNTDYFGFSEMLRSSRLQVRGKKALVLGSGGASNTAVAVLKGLGARTVAISRSGPDNYENIHRHSDAALIVNATPVGMYPHVDETPLRLDAFIALEGVLDVIYNPARTQLLLEAEARGIPAVNGLLMLVAQAKESAEWFTAQPIPDDRIMKIHRSLKIQMENIILVGMPGCGKSTIAGKLAAFLGREAVDADREIEIAAGCSIPEIFKKGGEAAFRALETQILADLGKHSGLVIATGGGCVTRSENYPLLHRNGTIFYLTRDLNLLPTDGRPLSQAGSLELMYQFRKPMYEAFADYTIDNNGNAEATVRTIMRVLEGNL